MKYLASCLLLTLATANCSSADSASDGAAARTNVTAPDTITGTDATTGTDTVTPADTTRATDTATPEDTTVAPDPCAEDNGGCDANAQCTNQVGAEPVCTCKTGFLEDPTGACVPTPACQFVECGANSYCDDGSCFCETGFETDTDGACIDINECAGVDCGANSVCTHTEGETVVGQYTCACESGYTLSDNGCVSIPCSLTTWPAKALEGCLELQNAVLTGANLAGVNLSDADLAGANLNGADLTNADLTNTRLEGADLNGAGLDYANLNNTSLTGADLAGVNLHKADLTGVQSNNITGTPSALPAGWQIVDGTLVYSP